MGTIDDQPSHEAQIIQQLATSNEQYAAALEKVQNENVEHQITISVLKDQLANAVKDTTEARVHASKLNMAKTQLEERLQSMQSVPTAAPSPPPYTPTPVDPAPVTVVDPKPTSRRRGGKRADLMNGSAPPMPRI